MKLNKDQKQKLLLGGMIVIGVVYAYFEFLLGPLRNAENAAAKKAKALEPQIAAAKAQLAKVEQLKTKQPDAKKFMQQVNSMIPEGSPIAWFPPRLTEFFKKHGIDRITARMNTDTAEKELNGFRKLNWSAEAPKADFIVFAAAVAALENEEPLVEIQSFEAEAGREDVSFQRAALTLNNLMHL
jgi:hypothetical protein